MKSRSKNINIYFISMLFICLYATKGFGQIERNLRFGLLYNRTISTSPRIKHLDGQSINIKPLYFSTGNEIGLFLKYNSSPKENWIFTASESLIPATFRINVSKSNNPIYDLEIKEKYNGILIGFWKLGLKYERKIFEKKNLNLNAFAGMSINFIISNRTNATYTYGIDSSKITAFYLSCSGKKQTLLSPCAGISSYFNLFRQKDLRFALDYNYSPRNISSGHYIFFPTSEKYSFGSYAVRGHYFSFGATYIFGGQKKLKKN